MPRLVREGRPFPLGATWDGLGVNFALFSANATKVELCLFDAGGDRELERIELPEYTDEVWHGYLPEGAAGHGLRLSRARPLRAGAGASLQPEQAAARSLCRSSSSAQLKWDDALFGYTIGTSGDDLSFDERDSAPFMPKCRVVDPTFDWGRDRAPHDPLGRTVIYEAHVQGFTKLHPAVPEELRGTFAGLGERRRDRLHRALGVTLGRAAADPRLRRRPPSARARACATTGATTRIGFFAPEPRYLAPAPIANEFKEMVARSARRRHRGDPRRGLQPHRRGQRARPDAVASRASTTPATTGCCRTSRATTSTTPAPATR